MPTLKDAKVDSLFAMFKGEPGTRKSTCALSFPTPQYWFNTDKKMEALLLPGKNFGIDFSQIEYDNFKSYTEVQQKAERIQLNCKYKTIVLDSITSLGDTINLQTLTLKSGTTNKDGNEKGMRVGGIPVNTLDDYKAEASGFNQMIAILKDIKAFHNVNVVLVAHVIGERNKESSTHFSRIIVTGGKIISAKIPAYCEEVYHFNMEKNMDLSKRGEYGLSTVHTGDDFARTMLPLPEQIIFGDKPLYENFLKPAINKLNNQQAITKL